MKHIETIKTVVIAVLITGIVAFIGGVKYQSNVQAVQKPVIEPTQSKS